MTLTSRLGIIGAMAVAGVLNAACSAPLNQAGMNKPMAGMGSMAEMHMSGSMSSSGITAALSAFLTQKGENPALMTITSRTAHANGQWSISAIRSTSGSGGGRYAFMEMPKDQWIMRADVPMTTACDAPAVKEIPRNVRAEILSGCS